jgi:hypothetical protein
MANVFFNRYLPGIGRFLIVVTFLEDALRIMTQWTDQLTYLHDYRHSTSPCTTLRRAWTIADMGFSLERRDAYIPNRKHHPDGNLLRRSYLPETL